jgi:hypothetical protein
MCSKILDADKAIVYKMCTTLTHYTLISAYEYGPIHDFGEKAGIINKLNYMTVINRLRKALESLYTDGKCDRMKFGKGYTYNFIKSLNKKE